MYAAYIVYCAFLVALACNNLELTTFRHFAWSESGGGSPINGSLSDGSPNGLNSSAQNRPKEQVNLGQVWWRPLASWGNRSKNNPPHSDFAQFMDNMAQEPDRYLLPVFQATAPRFGLLTRVRKFENFKKILPPQPLGAKVPHLVHWWGVGIPQGKIFWGPGPI